jgi:hypothetical protein
LKSEADPRRHRLGGGTANAKQTMPTRRVKFWIKYQPSVVRDSRSPLGFDNCQPRAFTPKGDGGDLRRSDGVLVPTSLSFRGSDNYVPPAYDMCASGQAARSLRGRAFLHRGVVVHKGGAAGLETERHSVPPSWSGRRSRGRAVQMTGMFELWRINRRPGFLVVWVVTNALLSERLARRRDRDSTRVPLAFSTRTFCR